MADVELPSSLERRPAGAPSRHDTETTASEPNGPGPAAPRANAPTAAAFFERLTGLGPFRIIHQAGPSTFEAIAPVAPADVAGPFLNVICDEYHWHLKLAGLRFVQSFDQVHGRSGRRVLFFALADADPGAGGETFTRLYVHRAKGAEFDARVLERFLELHAVCESGVELAPSNPTPTPEI